MLIDNPTPFAAIGFGDLHRDGMTMAVVSVRASYELSTSGILQLFEHQEVALNDVYEGDPHRTPLVRVGDLIPYKPAADITLLGKAYAPGGKLAESWEIGIAVGPHEVRLRVYGPRFWEPSLKFLKPTWKLGRASPVDGIALDYRLAAGGRFVGDSEGRYDERNPIGPGVLRREASQVGQPLRAPQIEGLKEALSDPFATPQPYGFGPVPPFWSWREKHLGTRDEAWQRGRCPQMPADLSYRFFQTAHPDLILPYLSGNDAVRLVGLIPGGGELAFRLPGLALLAHHEWHDGRAVTTRLVLDGLHIDLRAPEGPRTVDLTWRGWIERCPAYRGARLSVVPLPAAAGFPSSDECGLERLPS